MSRFVRASKYRHVFGQPAKKEHGFENVKVTGSAWDTNVVAASAEYLSINWNASGGGAFAILPLPSPFNATAFGTNKLPDTLPLARSHTAPVLDTDWSPHNDRVVASAGEDGKVMIWKVEPNGWTEIEFFGGHTQAGRRRTLTPVARLDASARKVGQVLFHPTASNVVASASGEHVVKTPSNPSPSPPTGTLLATTCRDRKLRLFDPRAGGNAVRTTDGHGGIKGSRVVFLGGHERLATTGFSKMSDRQVGLWETGGLGSLKTIVLDQSAGVVMPFWSDNNILFLAGKGDGNIRYYEYESDALYSLSEHKSADPQRGMCFLPRRALSVSDCEIARAYKVAGSSVEPIAFIVPRKPADRRTEVALLNQLAPTCSEELRASVEVQTRGVERQAAQESDGGACFLVGDWLRTGTSRRDKIDRLHLRVEAVGLLDGMADSFQSDIFPPAPSSEPGLTAAEFFAGKDAPLRLVNLEDGVSFAGKTVPAPSFTPQVQETPAPTRTYTAPAPAPEPMSARQTSVDSFSAPSPASYSSPAPPAPTPASYASPPPAQSPAQDSALANENARLNAELRDAYAKIRTLELELEGVRANARRAAQALLDG
ncbi:Coronin [Mycena sanguinolenta]|uniref:Coronin n=1 Tax=Mycena sanguinolenta TaxID=230812 RepID=A0A8H6Z437_9AGAR|nr:Coronin [Mycena sanguinolenta]